MLEMMSCDQEDAVAWRIDGKVTEQDMHTALAALKTKIAVHGQVCIYQEISSFGGVELDAIMEKMQFFLRAGLAGFRRVAVVTDKRWVQQVISWENRVFTGIEMRAFSTEERDRAFNFLAYGDDSNPSPSKA